MLAAAAKGTVASGTLDILPAILDTPCSRYDDYTSWATKTNACSKRKNGPRRIRENHELGVYIAETLVNDVVRETEVLFTSIRSDGQLDIAVYTPERDLTDRSTFATANGGIVTSAAPDTCMACHLNAPSAKFSPRNPTGTGAGCR